MQIAYLYICIVYNSEQCTAFSIQKLGYGLNIHYQLYVKVQNSNKITHL